MMNSLGSFISNFKGNRCNIIMSMLLNFSIQFASNFTLADRLFSMLIGSGYLPLPFVS